MITSSDDDDTPKDVTFKALGVVPVLCEAIDTLGWKNPTVIQQGSIPESLAGKDVVGLAETGSGKTQELSLFQFYKLFSPIRRGSSPWFWLQHVSWPFRSTKYLRR